ncbi:COASY family protein [Megaselia abdita]
MSRTALLFISRLENLRKSLAAIKPNVENLYIHLTTKNTENTPTKWSKLISKIYNDSFIVGSDMNVRILVSPLKCQSISNLLTGKIDLVYSDGKSDLCTELLEKYKLTSQPIYLNDEAFGALSSEEEADKIYKTVVLGGTFDRIHLGHKILLTEAVLRATERLVVGVTDESMVKSKKLYELILPVEERIKEVEVFLNEIDPTLKYDIVPISDPFGPTKSDPDMDMIIVSKETEKGGLKVNELRKQNGLSELDIFCIEVVESDECKDEIKECKVSSSNKRIDMLGTRLRPPVEKTNIPTEPYIIGMTGGIGSGKSRLCTRFQAMGAYVIDCDKVAHDIYEPGQICYQKVVDAFGKDIVDPETSKIDRRKLGPIVFADPQKLELLNSIVWPELLIETKRRVAKVYEETKQKVFILEAAILLKSGWDKEVHEVWSTFVSPKEATRRIMERNGFPKEEAEKRILSQLDNKSMIERSNIVFSTEWAVEITDRQAAKAWKIIKDELNL